MRRNVLKNNRKLWTFWNYSKWINEIWTKIYRFLPKLWCIDYKDKLPNIQVDQLSWSEIRVQRVQMLSNRKVVDRDVYHPVPINATVKYVHHRLITMLLMTSTWNPKSEKDRFNVSKFSHSFKFFSPNYYYPWNKTLLLIF